MDATELDNEARVKRIREAVQKHVAGERMRRANDNRSYYETDNPDISARRKVYAAAAEEAADGTLRAVAKENKFAANEKVASSFFRDITDSKVQYIAGEGADVNAVLDDDADTVKSVTDALGVRLHRVEQQCLTDALVYGSGYGYLQVIDGALTLQHVPYCEVIPLRDRYGNMESVIRYYKQGGVEYADHHDKDSVRHFSRDPKRRDGAGWRFDGETPQIITAVRYGSATEITGGRGWASLPWVEMRHNNDGSSSLTNSAKSMIRCYDVTVSDFANNLIDIQDVFINLKDGYGSGMEYDERLEVVRNFKVAEGVDSVTTFEVPHQARKVLLDIIKADIYAALRGVDVGRISGGNLTNTAIRALYSDIDLWADQAEWHLDDWIRSVLDLAASYLGVTMPNINVTFTRRAIFDEAEKMDAIARQKGIISDKTLYENHPLVRDAQAELERMAEQELDPAYSNGAGEGFAV